jgi:hypothetical protein
MLMAADNTPSGLFLNRRVEFEPTHRDPNSRRLARSITTCMCIRYAASGFQDQTAHWALLVTTCSGRKFQLRLGWFDSDGSDFSLLDHLKVAEGRPSLANSNRFGNGAQ